MFNVYKLHELKCFIQRNSLVAAFHSMHIQKKKKIAEKLHLVGNTHQSETESVKPSVAKIIELYTIQVRCLHFNRDFARIFNYHHAKIK